jgi:hypothetical protein
LLEIQYQDEDAMKKFLDNQQLAEKIAETAKNASKKTLVLWATDCAERVLPNFERFYGSNNPKMAILAGRKWLSREIPEAEARKAAFAAYCTVKISKHPEACNAARSASQAASSAHSSSHALQAATYATKSVFYASTDEEDAAENVKAERLWQYELLTELIKRQENK